MKNQNDKYTIQYKNKTIKLNESFLKINNALGNCDAIKECFVTKLKLYEKMENTDIPEELKKLADEVKENEFQIQELFNFKRDFNYHRWWEVPKCKCPKMDNADSWGTKLNYHSDSCPVHPMKKQNE